MKEILPDIYIIDTIAFGQEKIVASYLIKGRNKTAIIDPGFPSSASTIREKLIANNFDVSKIDYIFLTHFHLDHSGGTGALIKDSPDAKVIVHKRSAFYVKNFGKIVGGARMVFRPELIKKFGEAYPVPDGNIVPVTDGDVIDLGGTRIRVIHTPGHCADEVSYFEENTGTIFTGDAACLQYPYFNYVPIPAGSPPIFDIGEEIMSLKSLKSVNVQKICIPHYGEVNEKWSGFIDKSIEAIEGTGKKITGMFKENMEFPQMIESLRADIIRDSGRKEEEIPEFLSKVYIREMLKTGLMGYLAYLLEYAPYPRAFSSEMCGYKIQDAQYEISNKEIIGSHMHPEPCIRI